MRLFGEIFATAAARNGGATALEDILAEMTRIFYPGFSSKVIDDK